MITFAEYQHRQSLLSRELLEFTAQAAKMAQVQAHNSAAGASAALAQHFELPARERTTKHGQAIQSYLSCRLRRYEREANWLKHRPSVLIPIDLQMVRAPDGQIDGYVSVHVAEA